MNNLLNSLSKLVDVHATEIILCFLVVPFLLAYCYTRDQLLGTILGGLVGGLLAICQKRATSPTTVENVEKITVEGDQIKE